MNFEYFDLLDENGNMTGVIKERSLVHKDGDWHKAVHIWIINEKGEILLQRRCATKDSDPNMLDISCAGHLSSGDSSLEGALRELKEELNLVVSSDELKFIKTLQRSWKNNFGFIDNEYDDLYVLKIDKTIENMVFQKEEISEIIFVPYKKFKEMVIRRQKDMVMYDDEFEILFPIFDREFDNKNTRN
ncbi:MAG: NUDIX domain-containing protein [Bacilli bacterium]|nr:NUDIX domain-containing protein [Bacilli bacterium]